MCITSPLPVNEELYGEWWKSDTEAVINQALKSGLAPNILDAHTINGHPGRIHGCQTQGGFHFSVEKGKSYMLRIINAALNEELFFKIAGHKMTVVEVDAVYVKPFKTDTIVIAPGQTTNAIITANKKSGKYMMIASPFMDSPIAVDNKTATATIHYTQRRSHKMENYYNRITSSKRKAHCPSSSPSTTNVLLLSFMINARSAYDYTGTLASSPTTLTTPPPQNASAVANSFIDSLRSLNSKKYPAKVPLQIDHSLYFTVGLGINPCPTCKAGNGSRVVADVNNVTFVMPTTTLLHAHYFKTKGVFTTDFPSNPPTVFNYTVNTRPANMATSNGTKLYRLNYNSTVQLVLQDTSIIAAENHPIHLHGFNFFAVGKGIGNYNSKKDQKKFNLVDPVERNTIGVPSGGWVAIRFRADNPGVWFLHCHLEVHTTWGLKMAFLVENGKGPNQSLLPPPKDYPKC
ncbi:hypothetical protein LXL04_000130 [Taraxacum kok-saghyz]